MTLTRLFLLAVLVASVPSFAYGQDKSNIKNKRKIALWGHVKDSFTKVGVPGVKITLMREDSTVVDTCTVFGNGGNSLKPDYAYKFDVPAEAERFIILAQHPDYEDTYVNYNMHSVGRNRYFDAPWHYMKRLTSVTSAYEGETLKEVTVKGTRVKIAYRGDTIVYDASAFKLPDGSMLDALVRQLPGAQLKDDGTITINGRKVDYLTLNGKDFFKGNNKIMLENLPYFTVQNIKVYDRNTDKNRYLGRDVEQKEYVMDVNLKKQYRTGYIGSAEVGGATSDRYMGRVFLSRFSDHTKVTAFANVNNINETRTPDGNGNWRATDAPEGKTTNRSACLNIQTDGKDNLYKNTFNILGSWNDYDDRLTNNQVQFLKEGNSYFLLDNISGTRSRQLSFNNSFILQLPVWIQSVTEFSFGDNDQTQHSRTATLSQSTDRYGDATQALDSAFATTPPLGIRESLVNRVSHSDLFHGTNLHVTQRFLLNQKLPWGDNLEFALNGHYLTRTNKRYDDYRVDYASASQSRDYRNIFETSPTKTYSYEGRLEYFFNFLNDMTLRVYTTYSQSNANSQSDYYRLDQLAGWESGMHPLGDIPSTADSLLSVRSLLNSEYENKLTRESKTGLNFSYSKKGDSSYTYMQIHVPLYVRNEKLSYQRGDVDTCASRTKAFLDGEMNMTFNWKRRAFRSLRFTIGHRTYLPDMSKLVEFDMSLPLQTTLNNPDLKTGQHWFFDGSYQHRLNNNRATFSVVPRFNYTSRPVLMGFSYNRQTGAYVYQPQNGDYAYTADLGLGLGGAIDKKQFWTYSVYTQMVYDVSQVMRLPEGGMQSQLIDRKNISSRTSLRIFYSKDNFSTGITGSANISRGHYNDASSTDYTTLECDLTYATICRIPVLNVFASTSFGWFHYGNTLESTPVQNNYVWNATLSRSLLKNKSLTIKLSAFDLLNTVKNYKYVSNSQTFALETTDRIGRYVMLSLAYKLNIRPKK